MVIRESLLTTRLGSSCDDIFRKDPTAHDGIYKIQVSGNSATIVECKFENGMGWTVIQKRSSGKLDFNRNWREYQNGFSTFSESGCKRFCGGEDICGEELGKFFQIIKNTFNFIDFTPTLEDVFTRV